MLNSFNPQKSCDVTDLADDLTCEIGIRSGRGKVRERRKDALMHQLIGEMHSLSLCFDKNRKRTQRLKDNLKDSDGFGLGCQGGNVCKQGPEGGCEDLIVTCACEEGSRCVLVRSEL